MMFHNYLFAATVYNIIDQAIIDDEREITQEAQELSLENSEKIARNFLSGKLSRVF